MWCDVMWCLEVSLADKSMMSLTEYLRLQHQHQRVPICDMTWHYYFNCMTLSTMSTIERRHITHSIYQYLSIHWQDGYSALYYASQNGQIEVVKLLLDRGADIEATDNVSYITMEWYFEWNYRIDNILGIEVIKRFVYTALQLRIWWYCSGSSSVYS